MGGKDEPTVDQELCIDIHDVAGHGKGSVNTMPTVGKSLQRIDGDPAELPKASTG